MSALARLLIGVLLLVLGRNLFWLFVAAIGFLAGASFGARLMPAQSELVILVVAVAVGLIGALLALLVPTAIGVIAGFAAGGYLALTFLDLIGANLGDLTWVPFLVGGVTAAIIVLLLFDWAVIALSSLIGATTIVSALALHGVLAIVIAALLFLVGVAVQTGLWRGRPARTASP